jgi:hypothetical protein
MSTKWLANQLRASRWPPSSSFHVETLASAGSKLDKKGLEMTRRKVVPPERFAPGRQPIEVAHHPRIAISLSPMDIAPTFGHPKARPDVRRHWRDRFSKTCSIEGSAKGC